MTGPVGGRVPGSDEDPFVIAAKERMREVSPLNDWEKSADVGRIVHAAIAHHVTTFVGLDLTYDRDLYRFQEALLEWVSTKVRVSKSTRQNQMRGRALGIVMRYFLEMAPLGWDVLGAELEVSGGRVDVAWKHPVSKKVLFDEIKGTYGFSTGLTKAQIAQVGAHAAAGAAAFGDLFVGVRMLTVVDPANSVLVAGDGTVSGLAWYPGSPERLMEVS